MPSTLLSFHPLSAEVAESSDPARIKLRNRHRVLQFADSADIEALYATQMPEAYVGQDISVTIPWVADTAITGNVTWGVSFERLNQGGVDLDDAPTWSSEKTVSSAAQAAAGQIQKAVITFTNAEIDGLVAGENFRIRVRRLTSGNTMSGAAQILTIDFSQPGSAGTLTIEEQDASPQISGVRTLRVTNGTLTDEGGDVASLTTGGGGGGTVTVREIDLTPSITASVIEFTNGTVSDQGGGVARVTIGGGSGFFSDGGGTNAGIGKGATAPTAAGDNSLAQGNACQANSPRSLALGSGVNLNSKAHDSIGIGSSLNVQMEGSLCVGDSNNITDPATYYDIQGGHLNIGQNNGVNFGNNYKYYGFTMYYYYSYGNTLVLGTQHTVEWNGITNVKTYSKFANHVVCVGENNTVYGGGNNIFGTSNTIGQNNNDQHSSWNTVFGYGNDVEGGSAIVHGHNHKTDTGIEIGAVFGVSGRQRFDGEYVFTSQNKTNIVNAGRHQNSKIVRFFTTTASGFATALTFPVETLKSYLVRVRIVARNASTNVTESFATFDLPTGTSDQDGRVALISRDSGSTIRLRNVTTTDATINLTRYLGFGTLASAAARLSISTTNILVEVDPQTATDINWLIEIDYLQLGG